MIWVKCEDIMLSEISQTQKVKYLIVLLIWSTYSSQIHGAKMWFCLSEQCCQGLRGMGDLLLNRYSFSIVVQSLSHVRLCDPMDCSMPGFPVHHHLAELAHTHVHWVSDAIQPSHPLLPLTPPAFNLSSITGLFNESFLHIRWPKYWSFSFSITPSSEYSGLISLRMDRLNLLAIQGTLKSLLQHHCPKASILNSTQFSL